MDTPYAFVTLVTSDHYLPGALAVAAALKDLHPSPPVPPEVPFQTACLVTPESVDVSTIKLLRRAFDVVIGVEIIEQEDGKGLQLLGEFRCFWLLPIYAHPASTGFGSPEESGTRMASKFYNHCLVFGLLAQFGGC